MADHFSKSLRILPYFTSGELGFSVLDNVISKWKRQHIKSCLSLQSMHASYLATSFLKMIEDS